MERGGGTAQEIYQGLLDKIGAAVENSDFDVYCGCFALPHRLETFDRKILIADEAQLRGVFQDIRKHLETGGFETLTRNCLIAEFIDDNVIKGSHETRLIDRQNQIQDSYLALSTLRLANNAWRVVDSQYAEPSPSLPSGITQSFKQRPRKSDD